MVSDEQIFLNLEDKNVVRNEDSGLPAHGFSLENKDMIGK